MAPSIPKTCKALVTESAGAPFVFKDVEVKEPQHGEILIKVLACGVCQSDHSIRSGHFGDVFPRIVGHEMVGEVVAVGPQENKWKVGDRAGGAWHGGHDGICKQCRRGQFQICDNEAVNGWTKDGGYSEYCILRTEAAVGLDKEGDAAQQAPLLCAGVTVFNGIRSMNVIAGEIVAIQGLGGLGHLGLQYSRKMGYRTVALSSSDKKKDFAFKLGANDYCSGSADEQAEFLQKMGGAALIVLTAATPQVVSALLNGLGAYGKLLILSPVGDVQVNTVTMIGKALSVHGWSSGHALDTEEAIAFAEHHEVSCMIEKFKLEDGEAAMKKMNDGAIRFRGVLIP